ncbi:transcriptional regulator [Lentilactobacillus fungorum]|uniref:Transcriptional regulator n=1 Tax=Lentilactobacillus fungorum TaxID=2201250 RepID=A0ABQ3VY00_9LACO|nr:helix-turn-helix transcriptional regulator [Lentilactobacillus fungorum]GHP13311.1 transcriptional regulator [Lentilactobacillus fungorum]
MKASLGAILKITRKQQQLTQKQLAAGICSQSMLSAIEKDQYTPNAQILIALCKRLDISLETISLSQNYAVSDHNRFNETVDRLCNQHEYQQLNDFLQTDEVLAHIESDQQMQAYYYYLGVSTLHTSNDPAAAVAMLKLSLASVSDTNRSTLTRLGQASLAFIEAKLGHSQAAQRLVEKALTAMPTTKYEENCNILFYLAALANFELKQYQLTARWLIKGISFAADHNSHYMLANMYHLLARTAEVEEKLDLKDEATQREKIFAELFHEIPYDLF